MLSVKLEKIDAVVKKAEQAKHELEKGPRKRKMRHLNDETVANTVSMSMSKLRERYSNACNRAKELKGVCCESEQIS